MRFPVNCNLFLLFMFVEIRNDVRFKWDDRKIDPKSNPLPKVKEASIISLFYQTMNVDVESEVVLVDLNDFVSATGGALGLFLGFSIIDTLFYVYDFIHMKIIKAKSTQHVQHQ